MTDSAIAPIEQIHMVTPNMLNGQTVLIVEADFLLALDIQRMLEAAMAGPTFFARSHVEVHQHRQHWPTVRLAIIDIATVDSQIIALLSDLHEAGIALMLSTTDQAMRQGHPDFPHAPVLIKPMSEADFYLAVSRALETR